MHAAYAWQPRVSLMATQNRPVWIKINFNGRRFWLFYNAIGAVAQCPNNWGVGSVFPTLENTYLWPYIGISVGDCLWDCDHVFVSRQFSSSPVWGWGEPTVMNFSSRKLPNLKTTTLEKMCWKTLWGRVWLYYFVCAKNVWGWVRGLNRAATPFSGLK